MSVIRRAMSAHQQGLTGWLAANRLRAEFDDVILPAPIETAVAALELTPCRRSSTRGLPDR